MEKWVVMDNRFHPPKLVKVRRSYRKALRAMERYVAKLKKRYPEVEYSVSLERMYEPGGDWHSDN